MCLGRHVYFNFVFSFLSFQCYQCIDCTETIKMNGCLGSRHRPSFFFSLCCKKQETGCVVFERPLCAFSSSLNGKYMKLVLLHLARCVQIRSCFKNNSFLLHDNQYPFVFFSFLFFFFFFVASFFCFHPDGWHHTWVSRRCLQEQLLFTPAKQHNPGVR